jgi:hypothetical protein
VLKLDEALAETLQPMVKRMVEEEVERAGFRWTWMSPTQAGRLLGISAAAVRRRAREGRIPARIEDGRIYVDMRAYDQQLQQADPLP